MLPTARRVDQAAANSDSNRRTSNDRRSAPLRCAPRARRGPLGFAIALAALGLSALGARAQARAQAPTSPTIACPDPNPPFVMPPEIVSSGRILKGTINLTEQFIRLPTSVNGGTPPARRNWCGSSRATACRRRRRRSRRRPAMPIRMPGPTLRARVGDLVQLTFINQVNSNRFDRNIDHRGVHAASAQNGAIYPGDVRHVSELPARIEHGEHPLPRDPHQPEQHRRQRLSADPAAAARQPGQPDRPRPPRRRASLDDFFSICAQQLGSNPLNQWPATGTTFRARTSTSRSRLLEAYQQQNPTQPLWDEDQEVLAGRRMAAILHRRVSLLLRAAGLYRSGLAAASGQHFAEHGAVARHALVPRAQARLDRDQCRQRHDRRLHHRRQVRRRPERVLQPATSCGTAPWNIRAQPVMVLNQLLTVPNRSARRRSAAAPDFVVNGRLRPVVQMQPGEVQLWRIANTAGRSAAYFQAPVGLQWRQIAQDGVQFANQNYRGSQNQSDLCGAGQPHRPAGAGADAADARPTCWIQNVMARGRRHADTGQSEPDRSQSRHAPAVGRGVGPAGDAERPADADAVHQPGAAAAARSWRTSPSRSCAGTTTRSKTLDFNSKAPGSRGAAHDQRHPVRGQSGDRPRAARRRRGMDDQEHHQRRMGPGLIDHPFHIHINPFQITELFDPNENLTDPTDRSADRRSLNSQDKTVPIPAIRRWHRRPTDRSDANACSIRTIRRTWRPCRPHRRPQPNLVWWDVFAIPSGRAAPSRDEPEQRHPGLLQDAQPLR